MGKTSLPKNFSVLILKADRLYAETLRRLTLMVLPHATVRVVPDTTSAALALTEGPVDLLVTGVGPSLGGDVFELLSTVACAPVQIRRVLVVTTTREHRPLAVLRRLAIQGVFDAASEPPGQFKVALRQVVDGQPYWSPSFLDLLRRYTLEPRSPSHVLSNAEQLVLSVIGDGSDDQEASTKLGLSPATVSTVRRNLHRKLGLRHRGELVRLAAQTGYVRFTPAGIMRPGFALLTEDCRARSRARREIVAV